MAVQNVIRFAKKISICNEALKRSTISWIFFPEKFSVNYVFRQGKQREKKTDFAEIQWRDSL